MQQKTEKKLTYGVYYVVNKVNGKFYIGGAYQCGFEGRYIRLFDKEAGVYDWTRHHNTRLKRAAKKHGNENFEFKIILTCDLENVQFFEQRFLDYWYEKDWKRTYNTSIRAGGGDHGPEVNAKITKTLKKFYSNPIERQKARDIQLEYWATHEFPQSARDKMSKTRKGRTVPEKTRALMRASNLRVRQEHPEIVEAQCGEGNPMFGRSVYSVWLEKYGKEEADRRLRQQTEKRNETKRLNKLKRENQQKEIENEETKR